MASTGIQAFVDFFNDTKPFHTKILEVVHKYIFTDDIVVNIEETKLINEEWANNPLCQAVGFGLEFDPSSGFDAIQSCNLASCVGGYGVIWDNSDLVASSNIIQIDSANGAVTVDGNRTYDETFQIKKVLDNKTLSVSGDLTSFLTNHRLFTIIPYNTYSYNQNSTNTFYFAGNLANQFLSFGQFKVFGSRYNDGIYDVLATHYDPSTNLTSVRIATNYGLQLNDPGKVLLKTSTVNQGIYVIDSYIYDGTDTTLSLNVSIKELTVENNSASIQFRTGFLPMREIDIENTNTTDDGTYNVNYSKYDSFNQQTLVMLDNSLPLDSGAIGNLNLYGYLTGSGFDGVQECTQPKSSNVRASFTETLSITILPLPVI